MPDRFEFDLSALEGILQDVPSEVCRALPGVTFEVTIGPKLRAAILAGEMGVVGGPPRLANVQPL